MSAAATVSTGSPKERRPKRGTATDENARLLENLVAHAAASEVFHVPLFLALSCCRFLPWRDFSPAVAEESSSPSQLFTSRAALVSTVSTITSPLYFTLCSTVQHVASFYHHFLPSVQPTGTHSMFSHFSFSASDFIFLQHRF
jgi:hypothetical protein